MRFKQLLHNSKIYKIESEIVKILMDNNFHWLVDSETENAEIEIKNNTIIWHDGIFSSGDWYYGIFKKGEFYGTWEGGIFEKGLFNGDWRDGINLSEYLS